MKKILLGALLLGAPLGFADDASMLQVSGAGQVFLKATLADIRLGVEVEGANSQKVQTDLSARLNKLLEALKKGNLEKIETTSFSVYPEYSTQNPREIKGYRGKGEVLVTTESEKAGSFIALGMESGATQVNGIDLKANAKDLKEAAHKAVVIASEDAMGLAKVALEALHLDFNAIESVQINPKQAFPVPYRAAVSFNAMDNGKSGPMLEGEQSVSAEVALKIKFKSPL